MSGLPVVPGDMIVTKVSGTSKELNMMSWTLTEFVENFKDMGVPVLTDVTGKNLADLGFLTA